MTIDWTGCDVVEVREGKVSGVPILKHSRVQADAVVQNRLSGESAAAIADDFDLNLADVRKVLAYAAKMTNEPALRP